MHTCGIFSSSIAVMLSLMVRSSMATIAYGHNAVNEPVAWIEGADQGECRSVRFGWPGEIPCDIRFQLDDGYSYYFEGCGGTGLTLFNGDGSVYANCAFNLANLNCGIQQLWTC